MTMVDDKAPSYGPARLMDYPSVVVTIACPLCSHRRGRYRLARLAARHGPRMPFDDLLMVLAVCKWRRPPWGPPPPRPVERSYSSAAFVEWEEATGANSSRPEAGQKIT